MERIKMDFIITKMEKIIMKHWLHKKTVPKNIEENDRNQWSNDRKMSSENS